MLYYLNIITWLLNLSKTKLKDSIMPSYITLIFFPVGLVKAPSKTYSTSPKWVELIKLDITKLDWSPRNQLIKQEIMVSMEMSRIVLPFFISMHCVTVITSVTSKQNGVLATSQQFYSQLFWPFYSKLSTQ